MGTIFPTGPNKILYVQYMGYDKYGRKVQKQKSSGSTRMGDARRLLAFLESQVNAQEFGAQVGIEHFEDHTFAELADKYLENCEAEKQKGLRQKRSVVRQLKEKFGNRLLKTFDGTLLQQYKLERLKKGNSKATANRHLATLKNMFTVAAQVERWIDRKVLERVRECKIPKEKPTRCRYLLPKELARLVSCAVGHLKAMIILAAFTGMRKGEIFSLKWAQVDFEREIITLLATNTKDGEPREVPILGPVADALSELPRHIGSDYVFVNPDTGKPYTDIKKAWHTALRKAKIEDFRFHDLRHTFSSHLKQNGVELKDIGKILGHSSTEMTQRYAHITAKNLRDKVKVLEDVLHVKSDNLQ